MKISVQAKPRSHKEKVTKVDDTHYIVAVMEPPVEGKANHAIASALAKHFHLPRSRVTIVSGAASRNKVFEVS